MHTEYEAKFINIDKDDIRSRLRKLGASLIKPEFLQTRFTFNPPNFDPSQRSWLRVRDEQDKITLTLKQMLGDRIEDQKEVELEIDSFENACLLLENIGCTKKAEQESLRELWHLDEVEFMIDTWPYVNPYLEIEGQSEQQVKAVSEQLGFVWTDALFCAPDHVIHLQHGTPYDVINNQTPVIKFDQPNPWT